SRVVLWDERSMLPKRHVREEEAQMQCAAADNGDESERKSPSNSYPGDPPLANEAQILLKA
ncbi:MAG: hypothetical protein WBF42_11540, partial [Terracidiphilus sp.]